MLNGTVFLIFYILKLYLTMFFAQDCSLFWVKLLGLKHIIYFNISIYFIYVS